MRSTLERLREPSTWGGLALLASMFVPQLAGAPEAVGLISQAGQAAAGLALIFMREAPR